MTLIENLEKLSDEYLNLYESYGEKADLNCCGAVDEQLPYAEEMLTNHYNPKEFYEIILKTGELLITSFTHLKNDGNNEIVFMDCTINLIDGEWKLLDDGYDVYEVDEVAYWKPIKPPKL